MQVFLSHNNADKADARLLARALAEHAVGVWFDEWSIRPGESIAAGIEAGLETSDAFVLIWSTDAARSNWVGTEIRAYLHRRVKDATLKIVPVMIDSTRLPTLLADYSGFMIADQADYDRIAVQLSGEHDGRALAQLLQKRLWELAKGAIPEGSPHKYLICPQCGSPDLDHTAVLDPYKARMLYVVVCMADDCKFILSQFGE